MDRSRQVAGPLRTVAQLRSIDRLDPLDEYAGEDDAEQDELAGYDVMDLTVKAG